MLDTVNQTTPASTINFSHAEHVCRTTAGFMLVVLIILANTVIAVVLAKSTMIHRNTVCTMVSLSMSDMCVGLILILPATSVAIGYWPYGDVMCAIQSQAIALMFNINVYTYMLMLLDKYITIRWPMTYESIMTGKRTVCILLVIWTCIPVGCLSLSIYYGLTYAYYPETGLCSVAFQSQEQFKYLAIYSLFFIFLPIISIQLFCYTHIYLITSRHLKRVQSIEDCNANRKINLKGLKTIGLASGLYIACWVPYPVLMITANETMIDPSLSADLFFTAHVMLNCNSWCNWVIYTQTHATFRKCQTILYSDFKQWVKSWNG